MTSPLTRRPRDGGQIADHWLEAAIPGGRIFAAFSERGISFVSPAADAADFVARFHERTGRLAIPAAPDDHDEIVAAVTEGDPTLQLCDFDDVTPFTRRVLEATAQIGRGETRSYQWLARHIGMPRASRAVGNALGSNPLPCVIPCHRIVRGDGTLGGYAFGAEMKRTLLAAEGAPVAFAPAA